MDALAARTPAGLRARTPSSPPPGQTARQRRLDSGLVGEPIGCLRDDPASRAEEWHPDPTFLFKAGGGPLLDMGPYYMVQHGQLPRPGRPR